MKLYNTLTKQVEAFQPLKAGQVMLYSCGPTVYDHVHIGNLSSFIFADTLRRVLADSGLAVEHVMNFTDVDDKTIARSQQNYPELEPLEALLKLTNEYGEIFLQDMTAVGNDTGALTLVKATDFIPQMQELIRKLQADGFAYIAEDGVYFSIAAYTQSGKTYGQLSSISASSTSTARIQNDEYDKAEIHDFALWKQQKPGEPAWEFELNGTNLVGRPGWHIECSAMSAAQLGQPFDIHTGGVDLIFPHHENEIAQSTAGRPDTAYARVFAHNEHLLVDGQKMSKSLNNFYTLEHIKDKNFEPLAFRLLVLQAHYRRQAQFSWQNLEGAQNRLQGYRAMADQYWQPRREGGLEAAELERHMQTVVNALQNDLDTPAALAALSGLEAAIDNGGISTACQEAFGEALTKLDNLFGLQLATKDISAGQKQLLNDRQAAREAKNWQEADDLRAQLAEQGITVQDKPYGQVWTKIRS